MTSDSCLKFAAVSGLLAVTLGAFGAHGLESRLSAGLLATFNTAVDYHFGHSLALLGVSILLQRFPAARSLRYSAGAMVVGILLFSGSLYLVSVFNLGWLGAVTPLGGLGFLLGWGLLAKFAWSLDGKTDTTAHRAEAEE